MTGGPLEVLLVSEKTRFQPTLLHGWALLILCALTGGAGLMFLLPLLADSFGVHVGERGYWRCVLIVGLTRLAYRCTFGGARPTASQARPS